jgi:molybdate transport system permease protein
MRESGALWLTMELAAITVVLLLVLGTPLAWWLAHSRTRLRVLFEAAVALPLVLPPTILGFYLLLLMSPKSPLGAWWLETTGHTLTFSFTGLVVASMLYSLPFVVQPLQAAFEAIGRKPLETAWTLGASRLDAFFTVAAPLALRGFATAIVLGFAHTLGEFGVVLMVGGSIPEETRVVSIAIFEAVERLDYGAAHELSMTLLGFSYLVMLLVYALNRRFPRVLP